MIAPLDFMYLLNIVLAICLTVGGFFAFRKGRQAQLTQFQKDNIEAYKDNIEALNQRIALLENRINDFEKENTVQRHIIDTITLALKQRGIIITISGDMVTIHDSEGNSTHRKRRSRAQQASLKKEEESV